MKEIIFCGIRRKLFHLKLQKYAMRQNTNSDTSGETHCFELLRLSKKKKEIYVSITELSISYPGYDVSIMKWQQQRNCANIRYKGIKEY